MEKDIANIFDESAKVTLSASEKEQTRGFLLSYVEAMPVRETAVPRQKYRGYAALLFTKKFMPVFSMLLAASLAVGGISYAAEGALPGDALYPVKVSVNEEVRSHLTVSPKAKAEWEARRAERRLEEAESLAAKNRLDAAARADIEERLTIHAGRVNERINDLEDENDFENAAEVSSHLEGSLSAHHKILSRIGLDAEEGMQTEIAALTAVVDSETALASESRSKNEGSVTGGGETKAKAAAEAKMASVGKFISATHEFLSVGSRLGTAATTDARARLDAADAAYAVGEAKVKAGLNSEAFILFQEAQRASREARLLIKSENRVSAKAERRQKQEDEKKRKKEERRQEEEDRRDDKDEKEDKKDVIANMNANTDVEITLPGVNGSGKIELNVGR